MAQRPRPGSHSQMGLQESHPAGQLRRSKNVERTGQRLPGDVSARFDRRFGQVFADVRVHTDRTAVEGAQDLGAKAYTVGSEVFFAKGQYAPNTAAGRSLLAHELAHVVQQTQSQGPLLSSSQAESAAQASGTYLSHGHPRVGLGHVAGPVLQRQPAPGEAGISSKPKAKSVSPTSQVLDQFTKWIDERIAFRQERIKQKEATYKRKNWKLTPADTKDDRDRISDLTRLRGELKTALSGAEVHGQDTLTLANVIVNEAGSSGETAKKAVAYAYVNRVGGTIREPKGSEISGYQDLQTRWTNFGTAERLTFLDQFVASVNAATARLSDKTPETNDPTRGATHWVSPKGLKEYDPKKRAHREERYRRSVGTAKDRAFPEWARDPKDPEVKGMKKAGSLGKSFEEVVVPGVSEEEFLFYRDVPYDRSP